MRFSKLGGTVVIVIDFSSVENTLLLSLEARRGTHRYDLSLIDGKVPDSVIINDVWYNLFVNYQEVQKLLDSTSVNKLGEITLGQYIKIKKCAETSPCIELEDNATIALLEHPKKEIDYLPPAMLHANLYQYQRQGYQWMRFIVDSQCGCILGDEMGLGKTLQVIALITEQKQRDKGQSLVIAPVSLLENWKREIAKFTQGISVCVHHGSARTGMYTDLLDYDVVVISYNTATSDQALLRMIKWNLLVVDEAQNIKNPSAIRTKSIKRIPCHTAIAVTGTPFENHMTDLWSLMDFVAPGCFGNLSDFVSEFSDDVDGARKLEPYLTPIMLRRRVSDVAQDLPPRIDVPQILEMTQPEADAYEEQRENIIATFDGHNATLPMLQKLRMYCTHPSLVDGVEYSDPSQCSRKYERLCEILEEVISIGEKTILFTSYNKMFEILDSDIPSRFGIPVMSINGSTPTESRQQMIDSFSAVNGAALLVLNPRAAGAGLNITAASRVIHYNLEWNPSLEDQASARAYRRGQDKTVFVYRLFYKGTVEEIINDRIEKKRSMFDAAVVGTDGAVDNSEEIIRALMITPGGTHDD